MSNWLVREGSNSALSSLLDISHSVQQSASMAPRHDALRPRKPYPPLPSAHSAPRTCVPEFTCEAGLIRNP